MPKKSVCIGPGNELSVKPKAGYASSVGLTVEPHVGNPTHDDVLFTPKKRAQG